MNELAKIRDVSQKYGVSVRTLRYYEDMGLLNSIREDNSAYRLYDESSIKRLERILTLRKLNISIKDIQLIFSSKDANILLEVLEKKITYIDEEAAQLYSLKKIVIDFIKQIKEYNFSDEASIKPLYERVNELEEKLYRIEQEEREENSNEINKGKEEENGESLGTKFISIPDVRVISLPSCKMVSSGFGIFGEDERFDRFDRWFTKISQSTINTWQMPQDFMWFDPIRGGTVWWYAMPEGACDTEDFEIDYFEGGIYVTAVSRDGDDEDGNRVYNGIKKWIELSDTLEIDERPGHYTMFHVSTSESVKDTIGYHQLEVFVPVKSKERCLSTSK